MITDRTPVTISVAVSTALLCLVFDTRLVWHVTHLMTSPTLGDFFGLWSDGTYLRGAHARPLYDSVALSAVQHRLDPAFRGDLPFFYPPPMMFLVLPLGLLGQAKAYALWQLGGLAAFLVAAFWRAPRPLAAAVFLVLPGTTFALAWGNTGFVTGALLLGGLRLVPTRPVLGGILLGLLTIKPQCVLLLPVALCAAGRWRAIAAAIASAALLAGASAAVFGVGTWLDWIHVLPSAEAQWHVAELGEANLWKHAQFATTVTASLALLHLSWSAIRALQILAAIIGAGFVWTACRGGLNPNAVVTIAAATFLATPHGFLYDMPALLGAVTRLLAGQRTSQTTLVAAMLLLALPLLATVHVLPFAGPPLMGLLAIGCMRRWSGGPIDRPAAARPACRCEALHGQGTRASLHQATAGI